MEAIDAGGNLDVADFLSSAPYDQWLPVPISGQRPAARYKHASQFVDGKLYVLGGSRNGRYLSDFQVFDIRTLNWSTLSLQVSTNSFNFVENNLVKDFPAVSGHGLVKWENKLFVVAGLTKELSNNVTVWSIDQETGISSLVQTYGKIPIARGGQSVALAGHKVFVFGGEDKKRHLLNDLHVLDLTTMTWEEVEFKNAPPSPRFDHTTAAYADQYLLVFGGSSHSTCFNDLHLLDLQTMEWSQPQTQGEYVAPRGGHAGTVVDEKWYIVGGGDNIGGMTETNVLNISKFVWSRATSVEKRDPLASEGLSICSAVLDGEKIIIAFGGYNGKYNNEVFILKVRSQEQTRPRLLQSAAAAAAAASVTAAYAIISGTDEKNLKSIDESYIKSNQTEKSQFVSVNFDILNAEKELLESRIVEVRDENSKLQGKINEINISHNELQKELQSVHCQLAAENARCLSLETHISQIQKSLESYSSLEHELDALRHQKSQMEQELVLQKQRSGGVWQWLSGTTENSE